MIETAALWLQRHSTKVLAAAILLGLFWQDFSNAIKPAAPVCAVLCMLLACARMDWSGIGALLRRPWRVVLIVAWALIGAPLVVYAVAAPFLPPGAPLLAAMVLNGGAPPILAAPAMALILGVEPVLSMVAAVIGTALAPFSVPAVTHFLDLGSIELPAEALLLRLLLVVAIVLGGAWLLKRLAGRERIERHGVLLEGATVFFIAGFGAGLMAGVKAMLMADPAKALLFIVLAFVLHIALSVSGALLLWWRDRRQALVMALLSGFRNMMMIYVVIVDVAHPDVILFVICAQFPMFLMPLAIRPLFRRLNGATAT